MKILLVPILLPLLAMFASCSTESPSIVNDSDAGKDPIDPDQSSEIATVGKPEAGEGGTLESTEDGESGYGNSAGQYKQNAAQRKSSKATIDGETPSTSTIALDPELIAPLDLEPKSLRVPSLADTLFQPSVNSVPRSSATRPQRHLDRTSRKTDADAKTSGVHDLALRSKKPTIHRIHPGMSFSIKGDEGTLVNFPAGSLAFATGEPCNLPATVKMWEFYSLPDILLAGLSTDCDEGFLQTGGMIYLEAEADGRPLTVAENQSIKIKFNPSRPMDENFDLFHGIKENNRISWRRSKAAKSNKDIPGKGSIAQITIHGDATGGPNASSTGSRANSLKDFFDFVLGNKTLKQKEIVTDFSKPQSFVGLGTVSFSNGAQVFFDGELEVCSFRNIGPANYQRCLNKEVETLPSQLSLDFEGSFLAAKIPPQHPDSKFSLALGDNARLNPIIRSQPSRDGCFILVDEHLSPMGSFLPKLNNKGRKGWSQRIGSNHAVRCLLGNVSAYSPKHYLKLNARAGRRFGITSPSETSSVGTMHGQGPDAENFAQQIVEATSKEVEDLIQYAENLRRQAQQLNQVDLRRFLRPNQTPVALESVRQRANMQRPMIRESLQDLRGSTELVDVLVSVTKQMNEPKILTRCSNLQKRLQSSIENLGNWAGQKDLVKIDTILAKAQAVSEFSSEFLSPSLGWHNLDKLMHRRKGMESFDLASDFSFDPIAQEEGDENKTKVNASFGPFFYAVWPKEGISSNAFLGANKIPEGSFKAIGFAVDDNGEIFADFQDARTDGEVELDLKAMKRDLFRKTVAAWQ